MQWSVTVVTFIRTKSVKCEPVNVIWCGSTRCFQPRRQSSCSSHTTAIELLGVQWKPAVTAGQTSRSSWVFYYCRQVLPIAGAATHKADFKNLISRNTPLRGCKFGRPTIWRCDVTGASLISTQRASSFDYSQFCDVCHFKNQNASYCVRHIRRLTKDQSELTTTVLWAEMFRRPQKNSN